MNTVLGVLVLVAGLIAWIGQSLSLLAPGLAEKLGVLEPEGTLDPVLHIIEARAEALTDLLLGWTLPLSALLMMLSHPFWPFLAIFGAGVYLYFSFLIGASRFYLKRAARRVGSLSSVRAAYLFAVIWAMSAATMLVLAARHLTR